MGSFLATMRKSLCAGAAIMLAGCAATSAQNEPLELAGAACAAPPVDHCPDGNCPGTLVAAQGPVTDAGTGRNYYIDYPCNLKAGDQVNLVLSLHGGGSYGNWQRHYFPLLDYVDDYRLVVITPNAPPQFWQTGDDAYLESIVSQAIAQIGTDNIASFWLAGHSQGGMTSNRIVCTPFFRDKVDGWLSLSGGRIGGAQLASGFGVPGADDPEAMERMRRAFPPIDGVNGPERGQPGTAVTPSCDMSYIFTTGELEVDGVPAQSPWAAKYSCDDRRRLDDIVDSEPGYVYDSSRQDPPNPAWGRAPRGGTARVYVYPNCADERLVADVVRLDKGHTEGLEPKVTQALIEMMLSAPGGKLSGRK